MIFVTAIVLAAGRGERFKSKIPKPLVKINSKPVVIHSLEKLSSHSEIREIILVVNPTNKPVILKEIKKYKISKIGKVVLGGRLRQDSVRNGLEVLDKRSQLVLIHDAARPLIQKKEIQAVILAAKKTGAAILGVPVKGTIKRVQGTGYRVQRVKETLSRDELWEVQTPQVFRKEIILEAYRHFGKTPVTDDAMLVEKFGKRVSMVMGAYSNIKITTPEDLMIAQAILKS